MEQTLNNILGKPDDYKICKKCLHINWYENKNCVNCNSDEFNKNEKAVIEHIEEDYKYYKNDGWIETDIDDILEEV